MASPRPLSKLLYLPQFKFHFLLECDGCFESTIGHSPAQFNNRIQDIFHEGKHFKHKFQPQIWKMVVKCTGLGDGAMMDVLAPVDHVTGDFAWEAPNATLEDAKLWVRVFEVGSERLAEAKAIEDNIGILRRRYLHTKKVQMLYNSEPMIMYYLSSEWKDMGDVMKKEVVETKEKLIEAHRAGMRKN